MISQSACRNNTRLKNWKGSFKAWVYGGAEGTTVLSPVTALKIFCEVRTRAETARIRHASRYTEAMSRERIPLEAQHRVSQPPASGAARCGHSRWRRLTEIRAGGKSVVHFDVPGSAAKSTHAGIPWLRFLRKRLGIDAFLAVRWLEDSAGQIGSLSGVVDTASRVIAATPISRTPTQPRNGSAGMIGTETRSGSLAQA